MASIAPDKDMRKQAQHIWSMLDEMADSDPAAYEKFIKQTMEEGKQNPVLPKPFTCVKTSVLSPYKSDLYINICAWNHVPKPKTDSDPISVASGPIEKEKDTQGEYSVVRLAFHPYVLEESFKNSVDRDLLINLGLDYVTNLHKVKVSRTYKECDGLKFKGDPRSLSSSQRFFGKREKTEEEVLQENLSNLSPDSLLEKIQDLSSVDLDQSDLESRLKGLAVNSVESSRSKTGHTLIEEISTTKVHLPRPEYALSVQEANNCRDRRLELRIKLDGVRSVAECELDITDEEVTLNVTDKYELILALPEPIVEAEAGAKFAKKTSTLTVWLPTQSKS